MEKELDSKVKEEMIDLEEEVKDNERIHQRSQRELADAVKWENTAKITYADSIIKLDTFKKEHNIK